MPKCIRCYENRNIDQMVKGSTHCKPCHNAASREYYKKNKEKESLRKKIYNKEYLKRPEVKQRMKEYKHKESYKEWARNYARNKHNNDLQTKLSNNCRNRIRQALYKQLDTGKSKSESSKELLDCPLDMFIAWLEYNFLPGMTWENYGEIWDIDHIIGCKNFDLSNKEQRMKCFNWMNQAPLYCSENYSKSDKISDSIVRHYKSVVDDFIDEYFE